MSDSSIVRGIFSNPAEMLIRPKAPAEFPAGAVLDTSYNPTTYTLTGQGFVVSGVALTAGTAGQPTTVIQFGQLTLTAIQWAQVIANGGELEIGQTYFLSGLPGKIATWDSFVENNPVGLFALIKIGVAVAVDTLLIDIQLWSAGDAKTTQSYDVEPTGSFRACALGLPLPTGVGPLAHATSPALAAYLPGTPVYLQEAEDDQTTTYTETNAAAFATSNCIGLVDVGGSIESQVPSVIFAGPSVMSTAQWDAVIAGGSGGGLLPGSIYYLSPTAGKIQTALPTDPDFIQRIGIAMTRTVLIVQIGDVIQAPPS